MIIKVKICGLATSETVRAAVDAGARYVGFVFYSRSPRAVTARQARDLAELLPSTVGGVGLFVDPSDEMLTSILPIAPVAMIQLHGNESPIRVAEVRARYGLPVMKALGIATAADLDFAAAYEAVSDWLLFDARPPGDGALPGGNGAPFDWKLLAGRRWEKPWMLSGGLTPENVAEAIRISGATAVDVSSGVEDKPGCKNPETIRRFMKAATGSGIAV